MWERIRCPTLAEIEGIPLLARIAFAARCVRRVQPFFNAVWGKNPEEVAAVDRALRAAESLAAAPWSTTEIRGTAKTAGNRADMLVDAFCWGYTTAYAAYHVAVATEGITEGNPAKAAENATHSVQRACEQLTELGNDHRISAACRRSLLSEIRRDYRMLVKKAEAEGWTDQTALPLDFFLLNSEFDTEQKVESRTIIEVSACVWTEIIRRCSKDPDSLFSLTPREFEGLIAEIFRGFGFDVELTKQTRDGGRDVIAVSHRVVSVKYLLECKRYARDKTVGIACVQRLHGVTLSEGATKGVLVTTSRFTQPARQHISKHCWLLDGKDFEGLVEWLEMYQNLRMREMAVFLSPVSKKLEQVRKHLRTRRST